MSGPAGDAATGAEQLAKLIAELERLGAAVAENARACESLAHGAIAPLLERVQKLREMALDLPLEATPARSRAVDGLLFVAREGSELFEALSAKLVAELTEAVQRALARGVLDGN
jgi:hypothetical protein